MHCNNGSFPQRVFRYQAGWALNLRPVAVNFANSSETIFETVTPFHLMRSGRDPPADSFGSAQLAAAVPVIALILSWQIIVRQSLQVPMSIFHLEAISRAKKGG
jgi:hypothetical protein